jgi:hypothetical protein
VPRLRLGQEGELEAEKLLVDLQQAC